MDLKLNHGLKFPRVVLTHGDENYIFDLLLKLTVSHLPTVILALKEFQHALHDFPPEVFLQKPKLIQVDSLYLLGIYVYAFKALFALVLNPPDNTGAGPSTIFVSALSCIRKLFHQIEASLALFMRASSRTSGLERPSQVLFRHQ
jgi:hypothetical protein